MHIETLAKRNQWAIKLSFENPDIVSAHMIVLDHVKSDLTCLDDKMSLCLPTLSASSYVPGSPSAKVHT